MFSPLAYANWILPTLLAGIVAVRLIPARGLLSRCVQGYLLAQVGYFVALFPISLRGPNSSSYYVAFVLMSACDYLLQFSLLYLVARDLEPTQVFGKLRYWAMITLAATVAASSIALVSCAKHTPDASLIIHIGQVLSIGRHMAILTVALYGYVVATPWPRHALLTWLGVAAYAISDLVSARLDLLTAYRFHSYLSLLPTLGFAVALALWWRIPLNDASPETLPLKRGAAL
jgi:hypothetical protein